MKKLFAFCLILSTILLLVSCDVVNHTDGSKMFTTTVPIFSTTEAPAIIERPPLIYDVKFIGAGSEEFTPYFSLVYITDVVEYDNGQFSQLNGDGPLMFFSVENHLPEIAGEIPLVTADEASAVRITAGEGIYYDEIALVTVYDEDFQRSAEIAVSELETLTEPSYVYFRIHFSDRITPYVKEVCNGYFVKLNF